MSEKISLKKPIRYEKDAAIQKAFNDVYKHINELVDSVNKAGTDALGEGDGKEGDMRVVQKSDQNVSLEVRVEEGWYESQLFDTNPDISTSTITDCTDSLDGATFTGSALTTSATPSHEELEACIGVLGGKINILNGKIKEIADLIQEMNVSGFKILDRRHQ